MVYLVAVEKELPPPPSILKTWSKFDKIGGGLSPHYGCLFFVWYILNVSFSTFIAYFFLKLL